MTKTSERAFALSLSGHRPPVDYDRAPDYAAMIAEKDVLVAELADPSLEVTESCLAMRIFLPTLMPQN